jgi:hypothetical protein
MMQQVRQYEAREQERAEVAMKRGTESGNRSDDMSMDYLVEAVRHKVRNDTLFANLCKSLQHMMAEGGVSELDIVCAARIAAEENVRKQQEAYWDRELTRPFVVPDPRRSIQTPLRGCVEPALHAGPQSIQDSIPRDE